MRAKIIPFLKRLTRSKSGNAIVIAAAGSFALVGGAGLGTDTVQWYLWKRQLQQAVDSGALAGAFNMAQGQDHDSAARTELTRTANTAFDVVRVANPPASGAFAGDAAAVEVIATTGKRLPFSGMFLSAVPSIRARAVATSVLTGEHCVIALAPTGVGVNVAGSANVELGCGVAANSSGSQGVYLEGSSWLNATPISSVGGIQAASSNYPADASLFPFGTPVDDPMASRNLQVPTEPASCMANNLEVPPNQTVTLSPGRYCNGLSLKGTVTMSPGVYIIDGGSFNVSSQATIVGEGVTIVLTGSSASDIGRVYIAGGADVDMRAPTAVEDPYFKNVLFFQDPRGSSHESEIQGGSGLDFEGIIYMPKGNLRFAGNSTQSSECLLLVGSRVTFTGTTSLANNCSTEYDDLNLAARRIQLVE
jgi:hypothetical protein